MKTLTVRLPDALAAQIESESRARRLSKSDVVRERLARPAGAPAGEPATLAAISDLIGCVDGMASNVSAEKKAHLRASGYGRKHSR